MHLFEHLPDNYITKAEAKALGWVSTKGNLWDVAPGKSIGGDRFGNYEKVLPEKKSRKYYECDVNYEGGYRIDDRLVYSSDGLIYFTDGFGTFPAQKPDYDTAFVFVDDEWNSYDVATWAIKLVLQKEEI